MVVDVVEQGSGGKQHFRSIQRKMVDGNIMLAWIGSLKQRAIRGEGVQ